VKVLSQAPVPPIRSGSCAISHLLLAARQRPGELVAALRQYRKQREDGRQQLRPAGTPAAGIGAHLQVLHDRHGGEHLAPFGDVGDAELRPCGRRHGEEIPTLVGDLPRDRRDRARNRLEERRLARAVGSDHGDELAAPDVERHLAQRLQSAIGDVKRPYL